jgi:lipopolysaccharide export system protein LptA
VRFAICLVFLIYLTAFTKVCAIPSVFVNNPGEELTAKIDSLDEPISEEAVSENTANKQPHELFVEITADEIYYDQETNFYEAKGNAETYLPEEEAMLYADTITFNGTTKLLEAQGNVKVVQGEDFISGSYASFAVDTNEYLVSDPRVLVKGLRLKARVAESVFIKRVPGQKTKPNVIKLYDGMAALDKPVSVYLRGNTLSTRYTREQDVALKHRNPDWDDLPEKPAFRYTAKEVTYDDTKKINNLQIKGAKVWINDKLSLPSPVYISTTVGEAGSGKFMGPVIGTRERIGGFALGPRFFLPVDQGVFALAPIFQIGNDANFGGGAILSFSTPRDNTRIMGGYGSLENRFIVNAHKSLPYNLELDYLKNQFNSGTTFGSSQVGQYGGLLHKFRVKLPFIDKRGMRITNSVAFAQDNAKLFSPERLADLRIARGDYRTNHFNEDAASFRTEHNASFYTKPMFRLGAEYYNLSLSTRGQASLRFYGTGDIFSIVRGGPSIEARLDKLAFELAYLFSDRSGNSPFLFDQYIDGSQSVVFDGDYKINKWFSIGTFTNYNVPREKFTRNEVRTSIGPEDFKLRVGYDTIQEQIRIGFDAMFGEPVKFNKLNVKI